MNHTRFFIQFKEKHILRFLKLFPVNITNYKKPSVGLWNLVTFGVACYLRILLELPRPLRQQLRRRRKSRKYVDRF